MSKISVGILGLGVCLPKKILTNQDLEKIVNTSDEWIRTRTGISARHVIDDDQNVSDLAAQAGLAAVEDAGLQPGDIDLIIVASGSPEMIWPSTACLAQAKMGMSRQAAFDIQAACTGFSYSLTVAELFISAGIHKHVLVIGAEAMTRFLNWKDRSTCILFGDGAAAAVLGPVEKGFGLLANYMDADGKGAGLLKMPAGGSALTCSRVSDPAEQSVIMNGGDIFKFAVRIISESIEKVLAAADLSIRDIDYFIPHQANQRITDSAAERLGLEDDQVVSNIARYGNTGAASIPLAMAELNKAGKLKKGDIIVMVAFGAGLTWGANVIRWNKGELRVVS